MIDLLKPFRKEYPPAAPMGVGLAVQAVGYVLLLPCPLIGVPLILGGGALFELPFILWMFTERR